MFDMQKKEDVVDSKISPMMAQWHECKKKSQGAILFFRMGDFYEAFYEDAQVLAKELELTLTSRQDIPMSGFPHHTSEGYVDKLIAKGYRVAIAEQVEDPKKTKGLVKREVVRIVTPGTIINSNLLSSKTNNFFASLTQVGQLFGLAFVDLTTGELWVCEFKQERDLLNEIYRLQPSEFLVSKNFAKKYADFFEEIRQSFSFLTNIQEDWHFDNQITHDFLLQHFKVLSLDGFGLNGMCSAVQGAGALLKYLQTELCLPLGHIQEVRSYTTSHYMMLDRMTQRNLEITVSLNDHSRKNTLLNVVDRTLTPMGGRLMQHWVKQPLLSIKEINERQEGIQALLAHTNDLENSLVALDKIKDLERLIMKVSSGYATPKELVALSTSFAPIGDLKALLQHIDSSWVRNEIEKLSTLPEMTHLITTALVQDPPLRLGEGQVFQRGFHKELDELREISCDSKSWMARYQAQLREQTGIKTLKVGFNKMFGYFIEVSRGQSEKMPDIFTRRQTLVNAERYITPELKEYEGKVLTAEEQIKAIENELFLELRLQVAKFTSAVLTVAQAVARLDCLISLAIVAKLHHYIRPKVDNSYILHIEGGRHPVIETVCSREKFIANDTLLDDHENKLLLITGPNMAGKSTYLRQVALIVIMAQMGSFIPADKAHIGIVDKVYTRIGASDDLSRGQSTFMVEMTETANILHNVTKRSLVILDEIGRGTSTYDGISIAWSVAEFLLTTEDRSAKTLFATHYWELTKLEEKISGAVNYNVAVHESQDEITFLRKIIRGSTDKSYGIHVARLAGLPNSVIDRAKDILLHLEENANRKNAFEPSKPQKKLASTSPKNIKNDFQLSLFELTS